MSLLRQANLKLEEAVSFTADFADAYIVSSDLHTHILMSHASGELDGNITQDDLENAPAAIRANYDKALQYTKDDMQRAVVDYDRALLLGEWRGLATSQTHPLSIEGLVANSSDSTQTGVPYDVKWPPPLAATA